MKPMKKDRLEEFIRNKRDDFDFREPSPELWNRISNAGSEKKVVPIRNYLYRAAVLLAVISIGGVLLWQSGVFTSNKLVKNADPELIELMETEAYYSTQVDKKLKEIQKCYYTFPELKNEIETDLNELEDMYKVLKSDLGDNISNRSVIEAMIENNRFRLKLCDDVLEQINC